MGIAIGAGTRVACEASDIVIVRNSLFDVVTALDLGSNLHFFPNSKCFGTTWVWTKGRLGASVRFFFICSLSHWLILLTSYTSFSARTVFGRIKLNFAWAMGYNAIGIPFAAGVFLPLLHWRLPPAFSGT